MGLLLRHFECPPRGSFFAGSGGVLGGSGRHLVALVGELRADIAGAGEINCPARSEVLISPTHRDSLRVPWPKLRANAAPSLVQKLLYQKGKKRDNAISERLTEYLYGRSREQTRMELWDPFRASYTAARGPCRSRSLEMPSARFACRGIQGRGRRRTGA